MNKLILIDPTKRSETNKKYELKFILLLPRQSFLE